MNSDFNTMIELLKRYNRGEIRLSDEKAQALAELAFATKQKFKTKSKPIQKGLFDLIDTATLGLVPNKWRPKSIGQDLHGESGIDKFAGGLGFAAGIPLGGLGVLKGLASAPRAVGALGAGAKSAYTASKPLIKGAGQGIAGAYQASKPIVQGAGKVVSQGYKTAKPYVSQAYQSAKPWVSKAAKNSSDR